MPPLTTRILFELDDSDTLEIEREDVPELQQILDRMEKEEKI